MSDLEGKARFRELAKVSADNEWSQALSSLARGPHTHTFELWFVKTAMGRHLPMKARIR